MYFLAIFLLLSALAIAGCAAYFSIVGLTLLFVGAGLSIIIMGAALEVGKVIVVSFLHHYWSKIGLALKTYLMIAALVLMAITSIGIYGYLSNGYNATKVKVQGYEQQITDNFKKIEELKLEDIKLANDKLNQNDIEEAQANKANYIKQQLQDIGNKESKLKELRATNTEDKKSSDDILAAKAALDTEKSATDNDINKELTQIKLYNDRLSILDKEVQTWIEKGDDGGFFKKSGLDKARTVKEQQSKERAEIDNQIKECQARIANLRSEYNQRVQDYNKRMADIEKRLSSQTVFKDQAITALEKEIITTRQELETYRKSADSEISSLFDKKQQLLKTNKNTILVNESTIQKILADNDKIKEQILHTDVGTFKFVANSLGLNLDKTVNYFIWMIMSVFDPLAVCLILCFNYIIDDIINKKKLNKTPFVAIPTPTPTTTPTPTPTITVTPTSTPTPDLPVTVSGETSSNKTKTRITELTGELLRQHLIHEEQRAQLIARGKIAAPTPTPNPVEEAYITPNQNL